ncbi:unnamed protein product [Linum trigynum]|uniref:Uncharacterized protein n=1 Tax=Linum trigynum TaxID=586398 RepID=A0AAV2E4D4_9ROSI
MNDMVMEVVGTESSMKDPSPGQGTDKNAEKVQVVDQLPSEEEFQEVIQGRKSVSPAVAAKISKGKAVVVSFSGDSGNIEFTGGGVSSLANFDYITSGRGKKAGCGGRSSKHK